eukprot:8247236-Prorocentrum_lima.AAC.1
MLQTPVYARKGRRTALRSHSPALPGFPGNGISSRKGPTWLHVASSLTHLLCCRITEVMRLSTK